MGIQPKELSKLGYTNNLARSLAINTINKHCKHDAKEQIIRVLNDLLDNPEKYKRDQTLRASGPGGQHVNKTESAVRATHISSGLSITASDQRSQLQNSFN